MYGLYPRKGSIMVGADADIAIWDPDKKVTLSQELMHHGSDYTPYEGMEVTGWPVKTLLGARWSSTTAASSARREWVSSWRGGRPRTCEAR